ncbi:MAG: DUF885 family protein [Bacteroidota bacterium]
MKFSARTIGWLVALALIGYGLVYLVRLIWFQPSNIDYFFQRLMVERLGADYESLTELRPPFLDNFSGYDADLEHVDTTVLGKRARWATFSLATLNDYPYDELSAADRLHIDIMQTWLAQEESEAMSSFYYSPFDPAYGMQIQLPIFMTNQHPIAERTMAEDYLSRIKRWGQKFSEGERLFLQQEAIGMRLSDYQLRQSIAQIDSFLAIPPNEHPLYTTFALKAIQSIAIDPTRMNERLASEYLSQVNTMIEDYVNPAYRSARGLLASRLEQASERAGITALPNAQTVLERDLKRYTEGDQDINYWRELAQSEFQQTVSLLDTLLQQQGATGETRGVRFRALAAAAQPDSNWYQNRAYLKELRAILSQQRPLVSGLVSDMPFEKLNLREQASQLSPYQEAVIYAPAPLDNREPARLIVNPLVFGQGPIWQIPTLLWAKAWPGTHMAFSMRHQEEENAGFQEVVSFAAFRQGWEAYSLDLIEQELLLLETRPLEHIGFLQYKLRHLARAIVDANLQSGAMGLSEAETFLRDEVGLSADERSLLLNQVMARPNASFSRLAGQQKFHQLRQRAKAALEGRFYLQEFHDILLKNGEVPLSVLEKLTDTWIKENLAS